MLLRRVAGAVGVAALLAVSLPAMPAFAVPSAATLQAGVNVLPGVRDYSININNQDPTLVAGSPINAVLFTLPSSAGVRTTDPEAVQAKAPSGWTVKVTNAGSLQTYQYVANSGGIAPRSNLTFTFPTNVLRPFDRDQSGTFRVSTSTDKGATAEAASGTLKTTVRILEVLQARASAPAGVVDQTATAGQSLTVTHVVNNHAQQAVNVTPTLVRASSEADTVGTSNPVAPVLVPGNTGSRSFTFPVTLASSLDRKATFNASAAAAGSEAVPVANEIDVQAPARLSLDAATFEPLALRTKMRDSLPVFTIKGTVAGTAKLRSLSGALSFNGNTVPLTKAPLTGAGQTYEFTAAQDIVGADGEYPVAFGLQARDDNDFNYTPFVPSVDPVKVVIDNIGIQVVSELTNATVAGLDAVRDSNTVNLKVSVDDGTATLGTAELVVDNGDGTSRRIDVRDRLTTVSADRKTYSGTFQVTGLGTASENIRLAASATDRATNGSTGGLSAPLRIDNIIPDLHYAQTVEPAPNSTDTRILVRMRDFDNKDNKLTATEKDAAPTRDVFGGCTPSSWSVNGELLVRRVTYADGNPCVEGAKVPNNELLLVLFGTKDQDYATNVTYTPGRPLADPVRDEVRNDLLTDTVDTVIGIAPAPPTVVAIKRGTQGQLPQAETATFDDSRYFTRFNGDDLTLTFAGGRANYFVQVLDGPDDANKNGNVAEDVLVEEKIGDAAEDNTVTLRLGQAAEGEISRKVRLLNVSRLASKTLDLTIVYDVTDLAIATTTYDKGNVEVTFNDKVWSGTNNAFDWFGIQTVAGGRDYFPAGSVAVSQNGKGRTLDLQDTPDRIDGAFYFLQSASGQRYLDRAGNPLPNSGETF